jgi:hypothetical protein
MQLPEDGGGLQKLHIVCVGPKNRTDKNTISKKARNKQTKKK